MEKLGQNNIYSQFLGDKAILRTYKGTDLINEYVPLYTPPVDWSDIRTDCPANSIALYAGVKSDYSAYDNLGFTATCVGGYKVFIDGTQYGTTYASGATCTITWSTSGIITGDDITTPSTLKAHKIWIEPATAGNNITAFHCAKVGSASGTEHQGILWVHLNLSNFLSLANLLRTGSTDNIQCKAITAKNNNIKVSNILECARYAENLEYIAQLTGDGTSNYNLASTFYQCYKIKQIALKNMLITQANAAFYKCYALEEFVTSNVLLQPTNDSLSNTYGSCYKLKAPLPTTYTTSLTTMSKYMTYAESLENFVLDVSSATNLTTLGCLGSAGKFMSGFKGLRVSNEAPFDYATPPQITVQYTGMDRDALVQLFEDLPSNVGYTVVGSPTIDSNGVLTNITSSNLAYISTAPNNVNSFRIRIKFRFNTLSSTAYTAIFGNYDSNFDTPQLHLQNSTRHLLFYFPKGTEWGEIIETDFEIQTGQDYWADMIYEGTQTTFKLSTNGTDYQTIGTVANTGIVWTGKLSLGCDWSTVYLTQSSLLGDGRIYLNDTIFEVNNEVWFIGKAATNTTKTLSCVGCTGNQNKLSFVGNLTINNDIVSGFENNVSYFKTVNNFNTSGKSWTIIMKAKTGSSAQDMSVNNALVGEDTNYSFVAGFIQTNMKYWLSSDGATWTTNGGIGSITLNNNTDYWFKFDYDYTTHTFKSYVSTDKQNWELDYTNTDSVVAITSVLNFGVSRTKLMQLSGNIDLSSIELYIDNVLQFTREQYLSPGDKDIALNKGWSLTLS